MRPDCRADLFARGKGHAKAYELGANSFLVKSPDTAHLTDMVKCLCDYWLKFNEVPVFCTETDPANKILD